ncbi:MAG: PHP-associated domain-containing protein [Bacteroidota bacterium]
MPLLKWVAYVLVAVVMGFYFNTAVYDFPAPEPFSGPNIHNPYAGLDTGHWKLGNFHAHANVWHGLTQGTGSCAEVYHTYVDSLGYDAVGISNYQSVDTSHKMDKGVTVYEHGYGLMKHHQVVMGATEVSWLDYPCFQSVHHKQHVLNRLQQSGDNPLVAIAHPKRGNAYSLRDMAQLSGYDCLEAVNHLSTSFKHWDAALSAGHPVYLLASDDAHDHHDPGKIGRCATMLNLPVFSEEQVISALREGRSYGVKIYQARPENFGERRARLSTMARPLRVKVVDETLSVLFDQPFDTLKLVGQHGEHKKVVTHAWGTSYRFTEEDTYIRAVAFFNNPPQTLYFNPVFRYEDDPQAREVAVANALKTNLFRMAMLVAFAAFT